MFEDHRLFWLGSTQTSSLGIVTHAPKYKTTKPFAHVFVYSPVVADAVFDLDASAQNGGKVVDSVAKMQFTDMATKADADNVKYFDLSQDPSSYLERKAGGTLKEGQYYTHAYVLKWRASGDAWRSLLQHTPDHCAIVHANSTNFGVWSNRNGLFRDSEYDIVPQQDHWEVVVVTGAGNSSTGYAGTTTFYTMNVSTGIMTLRGTADRVCSGLNYSLIGHPGQAPGKIARVVGWNRVLNMGEIQALALELTRK